MTGDEESPPPLLPFPPLYFTLIKGREEEKMRRDRKRGGEG